MFGRRLRRENERLHDRIGVLEEEVVRLRTAIRNVRRIAKWDLRSGWQTNPVAILTSMWADLEENELDIDELSDEEVVRELERGQERVRERLRKVLEENNVALKTY